MGAPVTVEVHRNKRMIVTLREDVPTVKPEHVPFVQSPPAPPRRPDLWAEPWWKLMDGGTEIVTAPRVTGAALDDLANRFAEIRMETGPVATGSQIGFVRELLTNAAELPVPRRRYLWSDREYYGKAAPLWASEEVSGYNMITALKQQARKNQLEANRTLKSWAVQHNALWAGKMKTADEQVALWESLEPVAGSPTHAAWQITYDRLIKLRLEKYDNYTGGRGAKDLTLRSTGCTPGLWAPSFNGGDSYYSWNTEDTTNYTVRTVPYPPGQLEISGNVPVWCPVGEHQKTTIHAFLEPQRHQYFFRWVAVYVILILFSDPIFIAEINTSAMADRLPLGYKSVSDPSGVINGVAISNWIQQSNRYAVALLQDYGSQIFSAFFVKILIGRVDGMWSLHRGNQNAGDLATILDMERGDRTDRYYMFRNNFHAGGDIFNFGALGTQDVLPMDPSVGSIYAGTYSFSSF